MAISPSVHNALILSIVKMSKEESIDIFDIIQMLISETNWILSPGARDFGREPISNYVQNFLDGLYCYPLYVQFHWPESRSRCKVLYRDCLVLIHKSLSGGLYGDFWKEVSWYEFLTYLLFIQSNCHHKGNINSSRLCRNSDSFLNFFYKSKSGFNPLSQWENNGDKPRMNVIHKSNTNVFRAPFWVKAFENEKRDLLMFDTLAPNHYLGNRTTTGWTVRGGGRMDIIPYGCVLNQLREYYDLPLLSGDYGLGCMSESNYKSSKKTIDMIIDNEEQKRERAYNICDITLSSIGLIIIGRWVILKFQNKS
ncbi:MAG: hypothetical protein CMG46_02260 [Candidatus Marinimicrobia bacterium]|nr:hypothetical protein [Candidatus Neomarinimicrobiota bacterium]|tara:strand:+ start:4253 stop:5179 length:927 start_codon:yes stop_codon:yes gene_type:complete